MHVLLGNQRANLRRRIERIADLHPARACNERFEKRFVNRFMHEHAGAVGTDFALGVEVAHHRCRDGVGKVGIVEDDKRRLAAELHRDVFQRARCVGHHAFSSTDLPGQRDLGHGRMAHQQFAGPRVPLHHVEDPGRNAGFGVNLGEHRCSQRCEFRGFEDHRVAAGQRRRGFPARDLDRIVPRADADTDAERFAARVGEGALELVVLAM